jgi:hypothetical protein
MDSQQGRHHATPAPEGFVWWSREGLGYQAGALHVEGQNVAALAASMGTPLYL